MSEYRKDVVYKTFMVRHHTGPLALAVDREIEHLRSEGWHLVSVFSTRDLVHLVMWAERKR